MQHLLTTFLGLNIVVSLYAQDLPYARKVVDTLASASMHGRGYVSNGDKIAANYIAQEFKTLGLKPLANNNSYFQYFSFPINTFPGKVEITFRWKDGRAQKCGPGEDFLVRSASPSVKGKFPVVVLDASIVGSYERWKKFRAQNLKKTFVLVDTSGVSDKQQLQLMTNYVRYPTNVKGILFLVKTSVMSHSELDDCSRMSPWDFSQVQASVPVIEVSDIYRDISTIDISIGAKFIRNYTSQNVLAQITGSQFPDSFIVFTAHYDHLGQMGKSVYFPGANDNASGVAMLLNLAKHYAKAENRPKCSIAFMAFGGEEVALLGSHWYNDHPLFPLKKIRFLINMDILGTGDEGITVVNATLFDREFKDMQKLNAQGSYLPQIKPRGKAAISDHFFFTENKVPCFYIYTMGGIKAYHDTCDRSTTLPLTKFSEIFLLLRDFVSTLDNG
jgi:aminopeptidase YwaD